MHLPNILSFLRPADHPPEITDPKKIDKLYNYWRWRIFFGTYIGYVFFYFTRKSYTFAMPALVQDLGFSKSELGLLATVLYLTYGISKFTSGILSDRSNPRYFMAFGLIMTGVCNILFGLSSTITWFAVFWGMNGYFQGWGWGPCAKQLTHWYHQSERGRWWSFWSSSHNVGGFLIPILVGFIISYGFGWRVAMIVPGIICIIVGFLLMTMLQDIPKSLGLPTIEKYFGEVDKSIANSSKPESQALTAKKILFDHVLTNKYIWMLSVAYFFVYVVRYAINDWGALYLIETKNYSKLTANFGVVWFEIGGFLGTIAAGWGSDYFFRGRRVPVMILCTVALVFAILGFHYAAFGNPVLDFVLLGIIGFLIFGPQMLTGIAAAEFAHKKAAGTSTGFAGCFAYFGAAVTGWPLGKITQEFGWNGFFIVLIVSCVITSALLLPMWSARSREDIASDNQRKRDAEDIGNLTDIVTE